MCCSCFPAAAAGSPSFPSARPRQCGLCWAACVSRPRHWCAAAHWPIILRTAPVSRCLFANLPSAAGVGIALQMQDGSTRVLRMSHALEQHLQQEWTPYLLANAADIRPDEVLRALVYQDNRSIPLTSLLEKALGDSMTALLGERAAPDLLRLTPRTVSGAEMPQAVCTPVGIAPENVLVLAGSMPMLELVRAASRSAAAADAPAELRLAAKQVTLTDAAGGAAVEVLYRMVRDAEKLA